MFGAVAEAFGDRVIPIDRFVSDAWGHMNVMRPIPVVEGLLAATAKVHGLTLMTCNDTDVVDLGIRVFNPFKA